jgi:opacity protein-like surface antigen
MMKLWRLLVMAAALNLTAGAAIAAAQTVMVRNAPPGTPVEFVLNDTVAGTATVDPAGIATLELGMPATAEMDANVFVDVCDKTRRVLVVDRNKRASPAPSGCDRREVSGLFWVRRINTLVVDVGSAQPTLLLVRGSYTPPKPVVEGQEPEGTKRPSPKGVTLFGGGGLGKFRDALLIACGNAPGCEGDEGGLGYSFGGTFWFTRWLAAEGGYLKPRQLKTTGGDETFSFESNFDVDVFPIVAKVGFPAGPFRPYGIIGGNYHQSEMTLTQTIDAATQTFGQRTHGWGWMYGGGAEGWVTDKVALYGEFTFAQVKGKAEDGGEGFVDDRLRFLGFGLRIRLSR